MMIWSKSAVAANSLIAETLYRIYSQFGLIGEKFKTFLKKDKNIFGSMRNLIYFYARLAIQLVTKTNENEKHIKNQSNKNNNRRHGS